MSGSEARPSPEARRDELASMQRGEAPGSFSALDANSGRSFWKSLEEISGSETFEDFIRREYPSQAHKFMDPPQRREFLKLMGASLALAGATAACTRQPTEKILPYAKNPEAIVPGVPLYFATAMPWPRGAIGLLVESHMGRPTKIEGNPDHPASLGATDAFAQASVLGLYDPDRSQVITHQGRIGTFDEFLTALKAALVAQQSKQGAGLRILTETVTSPTLAQQLNDVLGLYPKAKWHQYEPVSRDNARAGSMLAFGKDVQARPDFAKADVIVSLDADFLGGGPECVRATRDFTSRRKVRQDTTAMNRLYVIESTPSSTGAMADHRLPMRSLDVGVFARALAKELGIEVSGGDGLDARAQRWVQAIAKDVRAHERTSVIVAGDGQPADVHALANAINIHLGTHVVSWTPPVEYESVDQTASLAALVQDMREGLVEVLLVLGGNPVFTAPSDLATEDALRRVALRVHLSLYDDETSNLCDWHIAEAHFLESWSDARAADGTVSIVQPLIAPLYGGKTSHELLAALLDKAGVSSYDLVREHWKKEMGEGFEKRWRRALHDGVVAGTAFAPVSVSLKKLVLAPLAARIGLELVLRPDPTIWDGRFANNGWLQELPKPITKLTWENTAQMSPATAERLGVDTGDVVRLRSFGRSIDAPVWVLPGHATECVTVHFGYGRSRAGRVGSACGFDAFQLRTTQAPWSSSGLGIAKTGGSRALASTQEHDNIHLKENGGRQEFHSMEGRDIVRSGTLEEFRTNPTLAPEREAKERTGAEETSLYAPFPRADYAWGMVIDLNSCTACGACVTACQSENNIPVVGKKEVLRGREMHWIRIDRYFEGSKENPKVHFQPIPCMHCENAPCEVVCPVGATTHSPEGLNEMTYNRCVGTRYCSNNCPYKVRRFNFFLYSDYTTESLKLQHNPDVTVRSRGVMEKCTYCVQRINQARIAAKKEDRAIRDGEIKTACQAVCPAQAIVFGNIDDKKSAVSKLRAEPHEYGLLAELNTKPRTTYLAKVKNPNPDLEV